MVSLDKNPEVLEYLRQNGVADTLDSGLTVLLGHVRRGDPPADPQRWLAQWLASNKVARWKSEEPPKDGYLHLGMMVSAGSVAVHIFGVKHLGDKYKFQQANLVTGENRTPDFLRVNPYGQIPAMKGPKGLCMAESGAMLRYLATKHAPDTFPSALRPKILMAMDKRQAALYPVWSKIYYYCLQMPGVPKPDENVGRDLTRQLALYERTFLQGKFVGGDKPCIADYMLALLMVVLTSQTVKNVGYEPPERWVQWQADLKADLGESVFGDVFGVALGYIASNADKVQKTDFAKYEPEPPAPVEWKPEESPKDGVLLIGHPGSTSSLPTILFCSKYIPKEKYKFQLCDILKGEARSAEYLKLNPWHQVPIARESELGDLMEHMSILRVLALKYAPKMYGDGDPERMFKVDHALDKRLLDLYRAWDPVGYFAMQLPGRTPPGVAEYTKLKDNLDIYADTFLSSGKFVDGDNLSIADMSLMGIIPLLTTKTIAKMGFKLPPRWVKYLDDIKEAFGAEDFDQIVNVQLGWVNTNVEKVPRCGLPKLYYFPGMKGRAEATRLIFAECGIEWQAVDDGQVFQEMKTTGALPFGSFPFLEDGDVKLSQSIAMARYAAIKGGIDPVDPKKNSEALMWALGAADLVNAAITVILAPEEQKAAAKEKMVKEAQERWFPSVERGLGKKEYLLGDFCYADLVWWDVFDQGKGLGLELPQGPIKAWFDRVAERPRIKEYVAKRG
eukprot:TRINITY_DN14731_c0_g1_i1.p1 TRINITY_DN14731_c0_g1~~TRINITY_DN14731_c0_g1_i1.p1  ORF type:complete len:763 (+),score=230.84 TRINITY_DN14731_c0_g1_i1:102-2291(+)